MLLYIEATPAFGPAFPPIMTTKHIIIGISLGLLTFIALDFKAIVSLVNQKREVDYAGEIIKASNCQTDADCAVASEDWTCPQTVLRSIKTKRLGSNTC